MLFTKKNKYWAVLGALLITSLFILLEHLNGGIITHHLLAREDLPGISNWWGLLTIPLLTWICLFFIHKRKNKNPENENKNLNRFLSALVFGVVASILWELDQAETLSFYILLPLPIALFKPLYLPEYLLGFVIGMLFTFGGMLPIIVGSVLIFLCFLIFKFMGVLKSIFKRNS